MEINLKDRYYLFNIVEYYPAGGLGDVVATNNDYNSLKEYCVKNYLVSDCDIFDRVEGVIIYLE